MKHRRMTQRTNLLAVTAAVVALGPAGCTQHYNGSLGMASQDREAAQAYQQQMQQREQTLGARSASAAASANGALAAVATPEPAQPDVSFHNAMQAATGVTPPSARPQYATNMAQRSLGALGLYGQVNTPRGGAASPLDGAGDLVRITFTTEGADFDPDVDPTGQYIVYASTRHRETADLYLKSVRGTAVTQLTNDPANEGWPTFSPDGQKIAFASDRTGNWDIYIMDARGGQAVQITSDATQDLHPSFSPDGRQLVYCSYGSPSGQWEMVIVDVENPTTRRVIGHGLFPNWSPTGDKIVFQRARQRGTRWFSIWTMGVTDTDVTPPTEIAVSSNAAVITPDWSADGRYVVFCTVIDPAADEQTRPAQADIWIVAADGSNRTRLTEGQFVNLQPVWSVDNTIYFVSDRSRDRVENVWAIQGTRAMELAGAHLEATTNPSAMVPTQP